MSREFLVSEKDGSVKKIICSTCGAMASKTDLKCPNCGEIWICAKCGAEFSENDMECPKCPPLQNLKVQPTESYKKSANSQKNDSVNSTPPAINKVVSVTLTGAIIGAILGIPLSYYFQSSMVQNKVGGIVGYFKHFGDIVKDGNLLGNVILSVIVFAIIGGLIGYFIDKNEVKKTN
jgi:predicted RNA-binding Zn-ribbon protein involved in translation (DUF1610 family)